MAVGGRSHGARGKETRKTSPMVIEEKVVILVLRATAVGKYFVAKQIFIRLIYIDLFFTWLSDASQIASAGDSHVVSVDNVLLSEVEMVLEQKVIYSSMYDSLGF